MTLFHLARSTISVGLVNIMYVGRERCILSSHHACHARADECRAEYSYLVMSDSVCLSNPHPFANGFPLAYAIMTSCVLPALPPSYFSEASARARARARLSTCRLPPAPNSWRQAGRWSASPGWLWFGRVGHLKIVNSYCKKLHLVNNF